MEYDEAMNKYWFRKRRGLFTKDLGWGWIPISWEGWMVIAACIGLILLSSWAFDLPDGTTTVLQSVAFIVSIVGIIALSAYVSHLKVRP